ERSRLRKMRNRRSRSELVFEPPVAERQRRCPLHDREGLAIVVDDRSQLRLVPRLGSLANMLEQVGGGFVRRRIAHDRERHPVAPRRIWPPPLRIGARTQQAG